MAASQPIEEKVRSTKDAEIPVRSSGKDAVLADTRAWIDARPGA